MNLRRISGLALVFPFLAFEAHAALLPAGLSGQVILNFDFTQASPSPPYGFVQFDADIANAALPGLHVTLYDGLNGHGATHVIDVTPGYINNGVFGFGTGLPLVADGVFSVGLYDTTGSTSMSNVSVWGRTFPGLETTASIKYPMPYFYPGAQGAIVPLPGGSSDAPASITVPTREVFDTVPVGVTERFYTFHVSNPGLVSHIAMDFGDDPLASHSGSAYSVVMFDSAGHGIPVLHRQFRYFENLLGDAWTDQFEGGGTYLDAGNNFKAEITAFGNAQDGYSTDCFNGVFDNNHGGKTACVLGAGDYVLGIIGNTVVDPVLSIDFSAAVSAPVPEPGQLSLLSAGGLLLAAVAASRARRNRD